MWGGGGGGGVKIMGWARPIFLEKRGGSLCVPDKSAIPEFRHLNVHTSSNNDENGKKRIPDDWQPRSNIKKLVGN